MNQKSNQQCRLDAIREFERNEPEKYMKIIDDIRKMLGIYLGPEYIKTCKAEGTMNEILGDLIDGTRSWDMNKLSAEQVIRRNIKSEVSNLAKKEKRFVSVDNSPYDEDEDRNPPMDNLIHTKPADVEGKIDAENTADYCRDVILKDDEDAQIIFNEMLNNHTQMFIAKDLGMTVEKVESKIRKIRRKISRNIPYHLLQNIPDDLKDKIINYR